MHILCVWEREVRKELGRNAKCVAYMNTRKMMEVTVTMTVDEKVSFILGYAYAKAEDMKEDGCFEDLTKQELVELLLRRVINENRKSITNI